jgi:hypothetical protein
MTWWAADRRSAGGLVHSGSWFEEVDSGGVSARFWPGIRYCPDAHRPRSISLHRSEQKGRAGLSCQVTGILQIGQVMAADYNITIGRERMVAAQMGLCPKPPRWPTSALLCVEAYRVTRRSQCHFRAPLVTAWACASIEGPHNGTELAHAHLCAMLWRRCGSGFYGNGAWGMILCPSVCRRPRSHGLPPLRGLRSRPILALRTRRFEWRHRSRTVRICRTIQPFPSPALPCRY